MFLRLVLVCSLALLVEGCDPPCAAVAGCGPRPEPDFTPSDGGAPVDCRSGERRCGDAGVEFCPGDGGDWMPVDVCGRGESCVAGFCLSDCPEGCPNGTYCEAHTCVSLDGGAQEVVLDVSATVFDMLTLVFAGESGAKLEYPVPCGTTRWDWAVELPSETFRVALWSTNFTNAVVKFPILGFPSTGSSFGFPQPLGVTAPMTDVQLDVPLAWVRARVNVNGAAAQGTSACMAAFRPGAALNFGDLHVGIGGKLKARCDDFSRFEGMVFGGRYDVFSDFEPGTATNIPNQQLVADQAPVTP